LSDFERSKLERQAKEVANASRVSGLFQTGMAGYVMAALYTNRYDLSTEVENLELAPKSWVAKYSSNDRKFWSTNSSAACK